MNETAVDKESLQEGDDIKMAEEAAKPTLTLEQYEAEFDRCLADEKSTYNQAITSIKNITGCDALLQEITDTIETAVMSN